MNFMDILNNSQTLNAVSGGVQVAGDIMGGLSHAEYGQQAQQAAMFQATQLRQNAGQAQASAQRSAYDVDLQSKYTASSALAAAAASGGGASDPTVVSLIAKNAGEFAYRKSVALFQGDDKARTLNMQADAKEFEGQNIKDNSDAVATAQYFKAGTSLLKSAAQGSSLLQRFGGDGPSGRIDL